MSDDGKARPRLAAEKLTGELPPPRMPPIAADRMTAEQKAAAAEMMAGERAQLMGSYVPILRSPALMRRMQTVGEYFRFECALDPRLKELASLLVARQWSQQYVWEAHTRAGVKCGLDRDVMTAIGEGRRPHRMSDDERIVHDFVLELLATKQVSDATYAQAEAAFGEQGIIDILGVVGYYTSMSMILNATRTPPAGATTVPLPMLPEQFRVKA